MKENNYCYLINNKKDWINTQKILFNNKYEWLIEGHTHIIKKSNADVFVIFITNNKKIFYSSFIDEKTRNKYLHIFHKNIKQYQCKKLFRKNILKKIIENE